MIKFSAVSAAMLLSVATIAVPIATGAHAQVAASSESRNERTIRQAFARWAAGGTSFFEEVLSPDVVWTI